MASSVACLLEQILETLQDDQDLNVDVEYVCNSDTGTFDQITTVSIDGVAQPPVVEPTDIPCDPAADYEVVRECRGGFVYTVLYSIEDDVRTEIEAVDTGEQCGTKSADCVKWATNVIFIDNTGTRYTESYTFEVTNIDGSVQTVVDPGGYAGWTDQLNGWVSIFGAAYPDTLVEARCNTPGGCGGLLPPPSEAQPSAAIKWRYMSMLACPTNKAVPAKIEIIDSSNPVRIGRVLVYEAIQTAEQRGQICRECGAEGELQYMDGTPVPEADLPVCFFECSETLPPEPMGLCDITFSDGCDNVNSEDPTDWVNVQRFVTYCEGAGPAVAYYIPDPADPTALVDYTLIGEFVDCASGEPIPEPPPKCDADTVLCSVVTECTAGGGSAVTTYSLNAADSTEQSFGIGDVMGDGGSGVKFDAPAANVSASLQAAHQAIIDCINSGQIATVDITDQDGQVVTLNLDVVGGDGTTQYFYGGDLVSGTVTGGKVRAMTVTCGGEPVPALRTVGCNDDRRDDLLEDVLEAVTCNLTVCPDPCGVYHQITVGRPNNAVSWQWGPFSGDTYAEFSDAMQAAGLTEIITNPSDIPSPGESHMVCGAAAPLNTPLIIDGVLEGVPATFENPDAEDSCAELMVGCNDDRRDEKLDTIIDLLSNLLECMCGPCDNDCWSATGPGSANCGETACGVLRVDASPDSLSDVSLQAYTLELDFANPDGTPTGECPVSAGFGGQTVTVAVTPTGPAVTNFADTINAELGQYGFSAAACGESSFNEHIAIKGPDCVSWVLWLKSNGTGDDYAVGYNSATAEMYEIEAPNGVPIAPDPLNGSNTSNGYYGVRACGVCDF